MFKALEAVRDELFDVQLAEGDEAAQLFQTQASPGHQTAGDDLVGHAAAPLDPGNRDIVAAAQVIDVADAAFIHLPLFYMP